MQNLENKVALITGGLKGIGLAVASAMLAHGMKVVITGRNEDTLKEACDSLSSTNASYCVSDAKNYEDQVLAVNHAVATFGKLDVVIANAGVGHFANITDLTLEQWQEVIDINLTGAFYSLKAAIEPLKATEGYYISIASLAGTNFFEMGTAYNASKFGLVGFTQAAMLDLRKHNIKISTIMPGSVATHFNNHTPSEADAWKIQPEDIGELVIDLLQINPRTLPSKIEVRPTLPGGKKG